MSSEVMLSVAMPTHNRSHYALRAIASILAIENPALQLVVSDTSTDGLLENSLRQEHPALLEDGRLKYTRVHDKSDMTDNYNRAVNGCDGEYICVIGDDDTITSFAVDAARWAFDHSHLIISQTISANYAWPDFRSSTFGMGHAGRLYVPRSVGQLLRRDSRADLLRANCDGLQGPIGLPLCYHGLVHRSLYMQAKSRTGQFFHGASPDISGAVAVAALSDYYLETDFPLTIPGAGGASNTGRAAMNDHKGDFNKEAQTIKFVESGWLPAIPRFFSAETIWAHAGLTTLLKLEPMLAKSYGYERLLALCRYRFPEYRLEIERAMQEYCKFSDIENAELTRKLNKIIFTEKLTRLRYIFKRAAWPTASGGRKFISDIEDISEARIVLERYMSHPRFSRNLPFCQVS
ncbi:glycosyltransferase [Microcoleus sp. F10-B2]